MGDLSGFSMLDLFRTEVENNTAILNEGLLTLEQGGNLETVEPLMRAAHSIKGAARIVGIEAGVRIAHGMEDCFVAAQEGRISLQPEDIDTLLRGTDMITRLSKVPENKLADWPAENAEEIEKLTAEFENIQNPAAPKQARPQQPADNAPIQTPVTSPQAEPTPQSPEAARVVRVTADNMSRLLGISGEFLVQTNWFQPFADELLKIRSDMQDVESDMNRLRELIGDGHIDIAKMLLTETHMRLADSLNMLAERRLDFDFAQQRMTRLADRLYHEVIASRMRPLKDGAQGFPRMIRDLGRTLGKKIKFDIVGSETEVDRDILEKLEAPLTHLLRNAADHGLESPAERTAAGKNETGLITLEASHKAGMLYISVSDDGRGVELDRVRARILQRGLSTPDLLEKMTEDEILEFMFLPGFSTHDNVSEISGRGVGLDVLRNMLQEVAGTVHIETRAGEGTCFNLLLPLTLSVIRSLLVEISGEPYAFPLFRVDKCLLVPMDELQQAEGRQYVTDGERNIGLVPAHQILDLPEVGLTGENVSVVIVSDRSSQYGLQVDRFICERDVVVLPLDARLGKIPDVSAAAVMEDGSPLIMLDVDDIVRSADSILSAGRLRKLRQGGQGEASRSARRILVVDDSITVREVQRRLLESKGYDVDVAVNGADGWNAVRSEKYDLLITDIDMPRMNGIELVGLIKQDENLKKLPVMIVSYKDREEDRIRGLQAGANYYLTKSSFHDETLIDAVVDLIGEAR